MKYKEDPKYDSFHEEDGDIAFGEPISLDGDEWMVDSLVYVKKSEKPIGTLFLLGDPAERMVLVQDCYQRALKLRKVHDEINEPVHRYISLAQVPSGMFGWGQLSVQYINEADIDIQEMPIELRAIFNLPDSQAPAFSVSDSWKRAGGNPKR